MQFILHITLKINILSSFYQLKNRDLENLTCPRSHSDIVKPEFKLLLLFSIISTSPLRKIYSAKSERYFYGFVSWAVFIVYIQESGTAKKGSNQFKEF